MMRIIELLNTVLPEDVLHTVPGTGSTIGGPLAAHPLVRTMTFTGSTGVGQPVWPVRRRRTSHPALLELGGKNALIVFEDANFDRAVMDAGRGGVLQQG